jgi:biopolymer transport protein ExbD
MRRRRHVFPSSSMSDIAFLLLLFFLILAITSRTTPVAITTPNAPTWEEVREEYATIYVSKEGALYLGNTPLDLTTTTLPSEICLLADKETPFALIQPVLEFLKNQHVTTIHCLVQGETHG